MPSKSKKQQKLFGMVHAIQTGKLDPKSVSSHIQQIAKQINPKDAKDFASTNHRGLPEKVKEITSLLREIRKNCSIQENNSQDKNPVAKKFTVNEEYDTYVKKFTGIEFRQKEIEAVRNYKEKPSENTKFLVKYESSDSYGNNTTTVIKKLKDGSKLCFTAFEKSSQSDKQGNGGEPAKETVTVIRSIAFDPVNEIESARILADFLLSIEI